MNGRQVAKEVKRICAERGDPKTPFILMTGWGGQFDEVYAIRECGVDAVVEKPVDIPELLHVIRKVAVRAPQSASKKQ